MNTIEFTDRSVSYETFLDDLACRVANELEKRRALPEYISQQQAFRIFGRANVERWRKTLQIEPRKRPGKLEYKVSELRTLQTKIQDYL